MNIAVTGLEIEREAHCGSAQKSEGKEKKRIFFLFSSYFSVCSSNVMPGYNKE